MKYKVNIGIVIFCIFMLVPICVAHGDYDVTKSLCYYKGVAIKFEISNVDSSDAQVVIEPKSTSDYYLYTLFKEYGNVDVGSVGTIQDGFLYYTEDGWKKPKAITQYETSNLLPNLNQQGTCPESIVVFVTGTSRTKNLYKVQAYASRLDFSDKKNFEDRFWEIGGGKGFTHIIELAKSELQMANDAWLIFANLDYSAVDKNVIKSMTDCLDETNENYMYYKYEKIVNLYSKHDNFLKKFKNAGYADFTRTIIDRYGERGSCYLKHPDRQSFYKELTDLANKALKLFESSGTGTDNTKIAKNDCQKILGDPDHEGDFAYYLDKTFKFIKFLAPLILIVMSVIDYIKVIASSDAELINKTNKKTIIRLIFALLLFVLPFIISYLLTLVGAQGKCEFPSIPGL